MFAADPGVIGKAIQVNGLPTTIVGVAPASFTGFTRGQHVDMWMSTSQFFTLRHSPQDRLGDRHSSWLSLIGRTKPGVSLSQAHAQLTTVLHAAEGANNPDSVLRTRPAEAGDISLVEELGRPLRLLLLVVCLILVIAAATVANLLLTRAYMRQQEIAMRTALGASRWRIVRQLLMEGAVLSFAGGVIGLMAGAWTAAVSRIR